MRNTTYRVVPAHRLLTWITDLQTSNRGTYRIARSGFAFVEHNFRRDQQEHCRRKGYSSCFIPKIHSSNIASSHLLELDGQKPFSCRGEAVSWSMIKIHISRGDCCSYPCLRVDRRTGDDIFRRRCRLKEVPFAAGIPTHEGYDKVYLGHPNVIVVKLGARRAISFSFYIRHFYP